ncbi:MAG: DUF4837 family protein [Prolixibacteraceae bacterium]|nr:DUF4837 family protein [Prolixibacteraceae bacterium]
MRNNSFLLSLVLVLAMFSCNNNTQTSMMRNVTGKAGEMVIVIAPELWDASVGSALKAVFSQAQFGLPQDEPLFSVINIPREAYGDIFKTSRNIVEINLTNAEASGIVYRRNVHAHTQAMVVITAGNQQALEQLVNDNHDQLIGFFLGAERERLSKNYEKYQNKVVRDRLEEHFGITMNVSPGFTIDEVKEDFMWIRFETPDISEGLLVYTYPYEDDSTFTREYLLAKRNVVLHNNVPGPTEGSYMSTEMELPVQFNILKKNGNYAAEMRGLWTVENDFMGGPFVSLSVLDLLKNRILTIDGYVYAPGTNKRDLIRQVEAMIHSVNFINQTDMDKLNKQYIE